MFMCCVICCVHVYACTFFSPAGDTDIRVSLPSSSSDVDLDLVFSFRFSSGQDGIDALENARNNYAHHPVAQKFPNVAFSFQCCCTSTETLRLITGIRDWEPRTDTSTFTQLPTSHFDLDRTAYLVI